MSGAGNLPAPVGNLPTGMRGSIVCKPATSLGFIAVPIPSGW